MNGVKNGDLGGSSHTINLENGGIVIEFNDGVDAGDARAIGEGLIADIKARMVDTGA